jgi:hypothetical protein
MDARYRVGGDEYRSEDALSLPLDPGTAIDVNQETDGSRRSLSPLPRVARRGHIGSPAERTPPGSTVQRRDLRSGPVRRGPSGARAPQGPNEEGE